MVLRLIICVFAIVFLVIIAGFIVIYFLERQDEYSRGPLMMVELARSFHFRV